MDIYWILEDEIDAIKVSTGHYRVTSVTGATCDITFSPEGRMLFNGEWGSSALPTQ